MGNERKIIDTKRILEAMFDDLAVVDKDWKMIYVSDGFEQQYKVKKEDVIGQHGRVKFLNQKNL